MAKLISDISETELITLVTEGRLPPSKDVVVDNGDDAAAVRIDDPTELIVMSTDSLVQGVHFMDLNQAAGEKLVAVNMSDLASMGARPKYGLLSLHLDRRVTVDSLIDVMKGFNQGMQKYGVQLIGGNVSKTTGPAVLVLNVVGGTHDPIRRRAGQVGDGIFVTGFLGDAKAGLEAEEGPLFDAQYRPTARVEAGVALGHSGVVTSMCDVSDGLSTDLGQLLPADAGAIVEMSCLPISEALRKHNPLEAVEYALSGGEEYELLFMSPDEESVFRICEACQTPVSRIGRLTAEPGIIVLQEDGKHRSLTPGFDHFQ